jgi:hypothetical protein
MPMHATRQCASISVRIESMTATLILVTSRTEGARSVMEWIFPIIVPSKLTRPIEMASTSGLMAMLTTAGSGHTVWLGRPRRLAYGSAATSRVRRQDYAAGYRHCCYPDWHEESPKQAKREEVLSFSAR